MKPWTILLWLMPLVLTAAWPVNAADSSLDTGFAVVSASAEEEQPEQFLTSLSEDTAAFALPCMVEPPTCCRRRPVAQVTFEWCPMIIIDAFPPIVCRLRYTASSMHGKMFAAPPNIPVRAGPAPVMSASSRA